MLWGLKVFNVQRQFCVHKLKRGIGMTLQSPAEIRQQGAVMQLSESDKLQCSS